MTFYTFHVAGVTPGMETVFVSLDTQGLTATVPVLCTRGEKVAATYARVRMMPTVTR